MNEKASRLLKLWKEEISDHLNEHVPYTASSQLERMANLFSPGHYYFYVLNFQNMAMDHVHEGTRKILGLEPEEVSPTKLMEMMSLNELDALRKKEELVVNFMHSLPPEEMYYYKVVYFISLTNAKGEKKDILHQISVLNVADTGKAEHILGVHTDITHLNFVKNDRVSFIGMNGRKSFLNVDPAKGLSNPVLEGGCNETLDNLLSKREIEVIEHMARGQSATEIAERMNVSSNTVRTHRKNILKKTECANSTEVVAQCLMAGVI